MGHEIGKWGGRAGTFLSKIRRIGPLNAGKVASHPSSCRVYPDWHRNPTPSWSDGMRGRNEGTQR